MAVKEARTRFFDGEHMVCPHCDSTQYNVSSEDVGLHECTECQEAFKVPDKPVLEVSELNSTISDMKDEIDWLKDRVRKLERELGLD